MLTNRTQDLPLTIDSIVNSLLAAPAHVLVLFGDYLPGMRVATFLTRFHQDAVLMQRHRFLLLSTQAGTLPVMQASLVRSLALPMLPVRWKRTVLLHILQGLEQQYGSEPAP